MRRPDRSRTTSRRIRRPAGPRILSRRSVRPSRQRQPFAARADEQRPTATPLSPAPNPPLILQFLDKLSVCRRPMSLEQDRRRVSLCFREGLNGLYLLSEEVDQPQFHVTPLELEPANGGGNGLDGVRVDGLARVSHGRCRRARPWRLDHMTHRDSTGRRRLVFWERRCLRALWSLRIGNVASMCLFVLALPPAPPGGVEQLVEYAELLAALHETVRLSPLLCVRDGHAALNRALARGLFDELELARARGPDEQRPSPCHFLRADLAARRRWHQFESARPERIEKNMLVVNPRHEQ